MTAEMGRLSLNEKANPLSFQQSPERIIFFFQRIKYVGKRADHKNCLEMQDKGKILSLNSAVASAMRRALSSY